MPGQELPDLDAMLAAATRGAGGPCVYVRNTTPEQRAMITERVMAGHRRWRTYGKWLESQGVQKLAHHNISYHFERNHDPDA